MTVMESDVVSVRPGHTELWARRAAPTPSTAVREIFAAAARPGIISLAGGNPDVVSGTIGFQFGLDTVT
jgi:2-aminoadipate transaminase